MENNRKTNETLNDMKIQPISIDAQATHFTLSAFATGVSAGFPSPADDYVEDHIDLNRHLIKRPAATFFARANGDSLIEIGIKNGDLLIVDRSLSPQQDDVVIVALDGELTCKLLDLQGKRLMAANPHFPAILITEDMELLIEGVVIHSIRYHRDCPG